MTTIRHSLLVALVAGLLFSGCATDTGRKAAVGAGIGAAVGAIIGNQSGEAKRGALLAFHFLVSPLVLNRWNAS